MTKVVNCSRCGETHEDITFVKLTRPMAPPEVSFAWDSWAPCPTNGEPIMQVSNWNPGGIPDVSSLHGGVIEGKPEK